MPPNIAWKSAPSQGPRIEETYSWIGMRDVKSPSSRSQAACQTDELAIPWRQDPGHCYQCDLKEGVVITLPKDVLLCPITSLQRISSCLRIHLVNSSATKYSRALSSVKGVEPSSDLKVGSWSYWFWNVLFSFSKSLRVFTDFFFLLFLSSSSFLFL